MSGTDRLTSTTQKDLGFGVEMLCWSMEDADVRKNIDPQPVWIFH